MSKGNVYPHNKRGIVIAALVSVIIISLFSVLVVYLVTSAANTSDEDATFIGYDNLIIEDINSETNIVIDIIPNTVEREGGDLFQYDVDGSTCWVINGTPAVDAIEAGVPLLIVDHEGSVDNPDEWTLCVVNPNDDAASEVWINAIDVLVNLPDVNSDIWYDITYSYSSALQIHGLDVPGITGEKLTGYSDGEVVNNRLNGDAEFIVPVYWSAAWRLDDASGVAFELGYRLVIYDAYRPYDASVEMSEAVVAFVNGNSISFGSWSSGWFVSTGVSAHNTGNSIDLYIVDATLPTDEVWDNMLENYPTAIDECSEWSAYTVSPSSNTVSEEMAGSEYITVLHDLMTSAGFTQLKSEWWHFTYSDGNSYVMEATNNTGLNFYATEVVSIIPDGE